MGVPPPRSASAGIRNIKEGPSRLENAKKAFQAAGGELKQFYLAMGKYDIVIVSEAPSDEVKATLADMRARRKAAQPSGIKTFGSTFKNPEDPRAEGRTAGQLLDAADCRGLQIGGAGFSAKHANFVENHGEASTADVIAVMAEGRRRVQEQFGVTLEPEVQVLGPVELPAEWSAA